MDTNLNNRGEITRLLTRVQQVRAVLTVTLESHEKRYTSSVLGVEDSCLLLDELSPQDGHRRLKTGSELTVFGRLDGIELTFSTGITSIDTEMDICVYHSTLPDEIRYNQRREFHRVPPSHPMAVKIRNPQGQSLESTIRDISLGGVSVQTAGAGHAAWLHQGAMLLCDLPIGRGATRVVTPIEVCHVRQNPRNRTQVVGTRLTGLDPKQRRSIQRYIGGLEREMVKTRSLQS